MSESSSPRPSPSLLRRLWPWAAAILSGVALTLCFPPWNQGWLAWFALTPLISAVFFSDFEKGAAWRSAALGYVSGLTFFIGTFWWLGTLAGLYQNAFLTTLPVLLGLFLALYFAFWSWFVAAILRRFDEPRRFSSSLGNLGIAAAGACAWLVHEWVRERLFGGFGWNPLGVALYRDLPMIQVAELVGSPGLSFLVAFANLMGVIIVRRIVGEFGPVFLKRIRWEFSLTMALIAAVFAFGVGRLWQKDQSTVPVTIVAVQPNIPQTEKFDRSIEMKVLADIGQLTSLAILSHPPADLVLWPESAIPSGMFASEDHYRFVLEIAQRGDFSLLLGTVDYDPQTDEAFNTALLFTGSSQRQQSYRKMHLVPFGEYLPLRPILGPLFGQLVPGDFTPGRDYTLLELPRPAIKLAALVCFEDTLGELTRHFVQGGAQALVNITNDGWFGTTPAAEQHLANAALRAVENRRPLIRCGNTGVTCSISTNGVIDHWLAPFQTGFSNKTLQISTAPRLTFYTRHGDLLSPISMAVVLAGIVLTWRRRPKVQTPATNDRVA